ncbi:hypothetical protein BD311DRAFT_390077 [Dichomitus squalens]|uniref:Uncharacterized protein n=1 Tax=Dichomitus squalens TaxID=114155 RepID=A0A4Q9N0S0_9APHY|nr:hypothetical protein BD311DRAFT_390077 [Dichomitus squalens]
MIAPALLSMCAAALIVSASAAPIEMKTAFNALPAVGEMTLAVLGPSEVPNIFGEGLGGLPVPLKRTPTPEDVSRPIQTLRTDHLLRLPRNANFREADYGVNPAAAFQTIVPIEAIEAVPSAATPAPTNAPHSRRGQPPADWRFAADMPDSTPPAPSPTGLLAGANGLGTSKPNKLDANNLPLKPDMSPPFRVAASGLQDFGAARYNTSNIFHQALGAAFLKPDETAAAAPAAPAMQAVPQVDKAGSTLPNVSQVDKSGSTLPKVNKVDSTVPKVDKADTGVPKVDKVDSNVPKVNKVDSTIPKVDKAGSAFPTFPQVNKADSAIPNAKQLNKAGSAVPDVQQNMGAVAPNHHRRLLEPTRYLTNAGASAAALHNVARAKEPVQELSQATKAFLPRHIFELNTDALLPPAQNNNVNLSDPLTAYEYEQKKHVGLINLDSNRPPVPPATPSLAALSPATSDASEDVDRVQTATQKADKASMKAKKLAGNAQKITGNSDVMTGGGTATGGKKSVSSASKAVKNAAVVPNTNSAVKGASKMVTKIRRLAPVPRS